MTTIMTGRGTIQTKRGYTRNWRAAHYRLMALSRSGRVRIELRGSLAYLRRLMRQSQQLRPQRSIVGRCWIELNLEPALKPGLRIGASG